MIETLIIEFVDSAYTRIFILDYFMHLYYILSIMYWKIYQEVIFSLFCLLIVSVIEVLNREYGDHTERMIMAVENGRCYRWNKPVTYYKNNNDIKSYESKYLLFVNSRRVSSTRYSFLWLQKCEDLFCTFSLGCSILHISYTWFV